MGTSRTVEGTISDTRTRRDAHAIRTRQEPLHVSLPFECTFVDIEGLPVIAVMGEHFHKAIRTSLGRRAQEHHIDELAIVNLELSVEVPTCSTVGSRYRIHTSRRRI